MRAYKQRLPVYGRPVPFGTMDGECGHWVPCKNAMEVTATGWKGALLRWIFPQEDREMVFEPGLYNCVRDGVPYKTGAVLPETLGRRWRKRERRRGLLIMGLFFAAFLALMWALYPHLYAWRW